MSKQHRVLMSMTPLAVALVYWLGQANSVCAQSPDIVAFSGNGQLTWVNSNTNLFYGVQWAPELNGPGTWHSSYLSLQNVQSSSNSVTVQVPMYYRISASSNRTSFAAAVPKTGQLISYRVGDDGSLPSGVSWPTPRFTLQSDTNVVQDNLTGLMWARNANLAFSNVWMNAIDYCDTLNYGGYTDWRLPNKSELLSLIDHGQTNASVWLGQFFDGIKADDFYWSSTTYASATNYAWLVWMGGESAGTVSRGSKGGLMLYVWPVRGGQ